MRLLRIFLILSLTFFLSCNDKKEPNVDESGSMETNETIIREQKDKQNCKVEITIPKDNSVVKDNGENTENNEFSFSVNGTITNIGKNKICFFQKIDGGAQWWVSGEGIGEIDIADNKWEQNFLTCGKRIKPHKACNVLILVLNKCPESGKNLSNDDLSSIIETTHCKSKNFKYKTK